MIIGFQPQYKTDDDSWNFTSLALNVPDHIGLDILKGRIFLAEHPQFSFINIVYERVTVFAATIDTDTDDPMSDNRFVFEFNIFPNNLEVVVTDDWTNATHYLTAKV